MQDEVKQEQDEVDGTKKGADFTATLIYCSFVTTHVQ